MNIFVIAGEPSGDMHGGAVIRAMKKMSNEINVQGWGGDHLKSEGMETLVHIRELAMMGISDILKNLPHFLSLFRKCKKQIADFDPDVLLLIDYSGFNLRIAKWAHNQSIKVHFYIAPKTWAWRPGRNKSIGQSVDYLYCIFPFEEAYFKSFGINASYVGNPLNQISQRNTKRNEDIIAILPGSRKQELEKVLPVIGDFMSAFPNRQYVLSTVPSQDFTVYEKLLGADSFSKLEISTLSTYDLLSKAKMALVTSGTATLEAAIIGCPQIVMYKTSVINYWIGKSFINTSYISLPNILLDDKIVEELIQDDLKTENIDSAIQRLSEPKALAKMLAGYETIRRRLGDENPANIVAKNIINSISS